MQPRCFNCSNASFPLCATNATPPLAFMSSMRSFCAGDSRPPTGRLHSIAQNRPRLSYPSKSQVPASAVFINRLFLPVPITKHPVFIRCSFIPVAFMIFFTSLTTALSGMSFNNSVSVLAPPMFLIVRAGIARAFRILPAGLPRKLRLPSSRISLQGRALLFLECQFLV